ncbi:MAG: glycosyltransferase family 2 protein [Chitinophagaceae bacterium]|nr:MAG: glycosyltransferase family 2 protein [Chitinophagaceae bacterium]
MNNKSSQINIDVLIPVASKSEFIREAVFSASLQSINKKIFIIENNIGDKKYSEYLQLLASEFSAEYIFFEQRLPIYENWNRCLSIGTSEWITFLHDDDIWTSNYLEVISDLLLSTDIIFYEFKNFEGIPPIIENIPKSAAIEKDLGREFLLAKMMSSFHHVSSTAFKRKLNLYFPTNLFMIADQSTFRQCIAEHKDIKVAWISSSSPNLIRFHPNQGTWNGTPLLHAASENAISFRSFIKTISLENLDTDQFITELSNQYPNVILSRILSAILFRHPFKLTSEITTKILLKKKSIQLFLVILARAMAQELIWSIKLLHSKYRSSK